LTAAAGTATLDGSRGASRPAIPHPEKTSVNDGSPQQNPPPPHAAGGPAGDPDEAAVAAEWRKIEAERIAEEREEAREDADDGVPPTAARWPWQAFAAALVAGLVLAIALNWPFLVSRPEAGGPAAARPQP